jgi:hypothetical protein
MQIRDHNGTTRNKTNIAQQLLVQSPHYISSQSIRYETRDRKRTGTNAMQGTHKKYSLIRLCRDLYSNFIMEMYQLVKTLLWRRGKYQTNATHTAWYHILVSPATGTQSMDAT